MKLCDPTLERKLKERLLALNFHAFLRAIALLLEAMGYERVSLTGRTGWVGRNAEGGADLVALLPVPGGSRRVVVQAKQYAPERRIYRRSVDELRGVALRAGAAEALLITTSTFSDTLDSRRLASAPLLPVRLIDGEKLADLLVLHRVGVWEEPPASSQEPACRGIDKPFFAGLEAAYSGVARPGVEDQLRLEFSLTIAPRRRPTPQDTKKTALPRRS